MERPPAGPERILRELERQLVELERSGVRWLSLPDSGVGLRGGGGVAPAARAGPVAHPQSAGATTREAQQAVADGAASTAPAASGGESLEALRIQFQDCRNCKLGGSRTNLVFGVGSDQPRILFVGEGPGAEEDVQGLPFVGRAGALLTGLIQAMGLVREDVYITNVVKCRPPGNRNPEPDEIASCRPILARQIELLDPRLIVTLGNVPLKVLKPEAAGITRERGVPFTYQRWQVLPTFHPSYLLRNPAAIDACWQDFRKALQMGYRAQ